MAFDIEKSQELAAELENVIADFLPDEDKDVSRNIALAVTTHVLQKTKPASKTTIKLAEVYNHMTVEEYCDIRAGLLTKLASSASI